MVPSDKDSGVMKVGGRHPRLRLEDVLAVRQLRRQGLKLDYLAAKYGVNRHIIRRALIGPKHFAREIASREAAPAT